MEWEVLNADVLKTGTFVGFTQLLIEVHVHNAAAPVFELMSTHRFLFGVLYSGKSRP